MQSTKTLDLFAAYEEASAVLTTPDGPARITGLLAPPAYFSLFGVRPLIGRTFDESEAMPGAPKVAVLSEPLWRQKFAAAAAIPGRTASFGWGIASSGYRVGDGSGLSRRDFLGAETSNASLKSKRTERHDAT